MRNDYIYARARLIFAVAIPGLFFFFQAEDGIRDGTVTGVQTCALPISADGAGGRLRADPGLPEPHRERHQVPERAPPRGADRRRAPRRRVALLRPRQQIGRASCRERVEVARVPAGSCRTRRTTPASGV